MKTMHINQLLKLALLEKVIIESLDPALYRLLVVVDGEEVLILEKEGKSLTRHNQNALRELLEPFAIKSMVLRHQSAYDEMIGQPTRDASNRLEVPLGTDLYPAPKTLH